MLRYCRVELAFKTLSFGLNSSTVYSTHDISNYDWIPSSSMVAMKSARGIDLDLPSTPQSSVTVLTLTHEARDQIFEIVRRNDRSPKPSE